MRLFRVCACIKKNKRWFIAANGTCIIWEQNNIYYIQKHLFRQFLSEDVLIKRFTLMKAIYCKVQLQKHVRNWLRVNSPWKSEEYDWTTMSVKSEPQSFIKILQGEAEWEVELLHRQVKRVARYLPTALSKPLFIPGTGDNLHASNTITISENFRGEHRNQSMDMSFNSMTCLAKYVYVITVCVLVIIKMYTLGLSNAK